MPLRAVAFAICVVLYTASLAAAPETGKHALPVEVKQILVDPVSNSPVVILEGVDTKAIVPIWIGTSEAASIALELEQRQLPRPNSHDLIRHLLTALDAKLERVTVTELKNNTYFAVITLNSGGRELHIDSRPSDAIAVALRAKAPIYAAPELMNQGGRSIPGGNRVQKTLGMQVQDLTANLASLLNSPEMKGVLIADVERGGLASRVGLERGDVITRVDKTPIHNTRELERVLSSGREQGKMDFQIQRGGKPLTIVVDLPPL